MCSSFGHINKYSGPPGNSTAFIFRAKNAKNSSAGVNVEKGVSTSSTTGKLTASGKGNGDINATAFELAWPADTPASTYKSQAKPEFITAFNSLPGNPKNTGKEQTWRYGKSCMIFVNAVLRYAGSLKDESTGSVTWDLIESDDWEEVGGEGNDGAGLTYKDLQPGDVLSYFAKGKKSSDGSASYKGYGLGHEAIYGETPEGKSVIIEAHFESAWGKVYAKNIDPDDKLTGKYFSMVRAFRWKKQGGGSGCNVCAGAEEEGDGVLATGGFKSVSEADKVVMEPYRNASNAELAGLGITVGCNGWLADNCPSFSRYFFNKYTNKRWTGATGNGKDVADVIAKAMNLPTGKTPKAYAIFGGPSDIGTPEGHTGVILGVDTAKKKVIIGEAGYCSGKGFMTAKEKDLSKYTSGKYTFVYLDSVLKSGGLASNE